MTIAAGFSLQITGAGAAAQYEQIRAQVTDAVLRGALPPGTRLPPIRSLASELGLSANTVARAYRELERDAVVITSGKRGTFVAEPTTSSGAAAQHGSDAERRRVLRDAATAYAAAATSVGFGPQETLNEIREVLTTQAGQ